MTVLSQMAKAIADENPETWTEFHIAVHEKNYDPAVFTRKASKHLAVASELLQHIAELCDASCAAPVA